MNREMSTPLVVGLVLAAAVAILLVGWTLINRQPVRQERRAGGPVPQTAVPGQPAAGPVGAGAARPARPAIDRGL